MSDENEFEPRHSAQTTLLFPCYGEEECPPGPSTAFTPPCPGYIVGRVTDARTGQPLDGVEVFIENGQNATYGQDITNALGHYAIGPLETGDGYILTAFSVGYSYRLLINGVLPESGLIQNVAMVRMGAVTGTLTNNGTPIEGVILTFSQQDDPFWGIGDAQTDADGKFSYCDLNVSTLQSLDGSTYSILASHPDYSTIEATRFISPCYSPADQIVLDGTMELKGTIAGNVTRDGLPLGGASVGLVECLDGTLYESIFVTTDAAGHFQFKVDAPASYTVAFGASGTSTAELQAQVTPGNTTSLSTNLAGPGAIAGVIADLDGNLVEGAIIEVVPEMGAASLIDPVLSAANGTYIVTGVPPYSGYIVNVTLPTGSAYAQYPSVQDVSVISGQTTVIDVQGDTIPPTCAITSPGSGDTLSGIVTVSVQADDNLGVGLVFLDVDGIGIESDEISDGFNGIFVSSSASSFDWDTNLVANGSHTLGFTTYDVAGNSAQTTITVSVAN